MRILLVDDSIHHRRAAVKQMAALGHTVAVFNSYVESIEAARQEKFDVALIDLLMPAESQTLGQEGMAQHFGVEMAVGYPLAIKLATLGIPRIAVATDTNHHNHPASAAVDWFAGASVMINGAEVRFIHSPMCQGDKGMVKDWAQVLSQFG